MILFHPGGLSVSLKTSRPGSYEGGLSVYSRFFQKVQIVGVGWGGSGSKTTPLVIPGPSLFINGILCVGVSPSRPDLRSEDRGSGSRTHTQPPKPFVVRLGTSRTSDAPGLNTLSIEQRDCRSVGTGFRLVDSKDYPWKPSVVLFRWFSFLFFLLVPTLGHKRGPPLDPYKLKSRTGLVYGKTRTNRV